MLFEYVDHFLAVHFSRALPWGAMMLVDGNLDGAVSPKELQKVLNFVKAREFSVALKIF